MVFKRYSSPFLFLDNLIIKGRFSDGIGTIYKQVDEEKMWQMYLSSMTYRAMNEDFKSYVEWKDEVISKNEETPKVEAAKNLEEVREKSINMLNNFIPE